MRILLGQQKGPTASRRATKARRNVQAENAIKDEVKRMDGYRCRWPGCDLTPPPNGSDDVFVLDACHFRAEGMGGNPSLSSFTPENLITLHRFHHRQLHLGLATMRPLNPVLGMRGPVLFEAAVPGEAGKFYVVGTTNPPKEP